MPKIKVPQKNMVLDVAQGAILMKSLLEAGLPVASSCLGDGICGKCRVSIDGEINSPSLLELETLKRNGAEPTERLACQVSVTSECVVKTSYW